MSIYSIVCVNITNQSTILYYYIKNNNDTILLRLNTSIFHINDGLAVGKDRYN